MLPLSYLENVLMICYVVSPLIFDYFCYKILVYKDAMTRKNIL